MPDYSSDAQALYNRHYWRISGINTESLGADLARQVLSQMMVVYKVFDLLKTFEDKSWTGFYLIKNLQDTGLYEMARYKEGSSLLSAIDNWLYNSPRILTGAYVNDYRTARHRIYVARQQAGTLKSFNPKDYRKLFDYEMPEGGKKEICWELPTEGEGFIVYKRNDELVDGLDQVGTYQTIQSIIMLAKAWKARNNSAILEIGDISRAGGLDTSAHKTHEDGKAFDMRPIRNDGLSGSAFTWNDVPPYHRDWTKQFIKMVKRLYAGATVYFNDPDVFKDPEFRSYVFKVGTGKEAHDNHLHVIFPGGERLTDEEGK